MRNKRMSFKRLLFTFMVMVCDLHENERRCDAEWTVKTCL